MGHGNGGWMNSDQRQATEARPAVNKGAEGRYEWTARTAAANEEPGTWAATEAGLWLNDELLGFPEPAREILRLAGDLADLRHVPGRVLDAIREGERVACADLVREAGCLCNLLLASGHFDGELVPLPPLLNGPPEALESWDGRPASDDEGNPLFDRHDSRCPLSLAAAIERRGEA